MEQALGLKIASYQKREDKNLGLKKRLRMRKIAQCGTGASRCGGK